MARRAGGADRAAPEPDRSLASGMPIGRRRVHRLPPSPRPMVTRPLARARHSPAMHASASASRSPSTSPTSRCRTECRLSCQFKACARIQVRNWRSTCGQRAHTDGVDHVEGSCVGLWQMGRGRGAGGRGRARCGDGHAGAAHRNVSAEHRGGAGPRRTDHRHRTRRPGLCRGGQPDGRRSQLRRHRTRVGDGRRAAGHRRAGRDRTRGCHGDASVHRHRARPLLSGWRRGRRQLLPVTDVGSQSCDSQRRSPWRVRWCARCRGARGLSRCRWLRGSCRSGRSCRSGWG